MTTTSTTAHGSLGWLLNELVAKLSGVRHAVVLSSDGLLLAHAKGLSRDEAEQLAAMASAFQGLARSAGRHYNGGGVRQTVVEMDRLVLFITSAGPGACLALLAAEDANMGMVAYESNMLVERVGAYLSAAPRVTGGPSPRPDPPRS
jgi:predicted regulator of Ras-like GTPase activity (Roadblock/LC7/MglB family)